MFIYTQKLIPEITDSMATNYLWNILGNIILILIFIKLATVKNKTCRTNPINISFNISIHNIVVCYE